MADSWHVVVEESDSLTDLCSTMQTVLNTDYVITASYDPAITVYRGASKHYAMWVLFYGDVAP